MKGMKGTGDRTPPEHGKYVWLVNLALWQVSLGAGMICKLGYGHEKRQVAANKGGEGENVPVNGVGFSLPGK